MDELFERLRAPFPPDAVSWRVGSMSKNKDKAKALAYLDARDVMRRLDEVVGPSSWQCSYVPMPNGTTCCSIGIFTAAGEWVWKSNGCGNTDIEAEKGAYSDAFKRAAVLWGIGQYLYDLDSPWVRINEFKQIEKDELPRLRQLLERTSPPPSHYPRLMASIVQIKTLAALSGWWSGEQAAIKSLSEHERKNLEAEKDKLKASLLVRAA